MKAIKTFIMLLITIPLIAQNITINPDTIFLDSLKIEYFKSKMDGVVYNNNIIDKMKYKIDSLDKELYKINLNLSDKYPIQRESNNFYYIFYFLKPRNKKKYYFYLHN